MLNSLFPVLLVFCFTGTGILANEVCFDVAPPGSYYSCAQQRSWGKCAKTWMRNANYCAFTCGFCKRSPSIYTTNREPKSKRPPTRSQGRMTQKQVVKELLPKKKRCQSVEEVLSSVPAFSYFTEMLLRASEVELRSLGGRKQESILEPLLSGKGSSTMTLFIPVNSAFDSSPAVDLIDDETLLAFVGNHLVSPMYSSRSLSRLDESLETYGVQKLHSTRLRDETILLENTDRRSRVLFADVRACNALLHFIDSALHSTPAHKV